MEEFLRGLGGGSHTAVEATRSWQWFVDLAEACGGHAVLSHPTDEGDYLGPAEEAFVTPVLMPRTLTLKT